MVILSSLEQLLPEDIVKLLGVFDPETLMRRALAQPAATRPLVFKTFGGLLVKCWPCVTAGYDHDLPSTCVEALRMAFALLASDESDELVLASAAVLDELMLAYLNVSVAPMAMVAFFHPAWEFRSIYGTLLMEVLRDLRMALPQLIALKDPDCIWLPNRDQAIELNKAAGLPPRQGVESITDQEALAVEAGCFRASLLWFLAFGGGLARNQDGGHDSTLLVDLGRATRGGAARELRWGDLPPPPAELVAKLAECSAFRGKWGALFASARAQLVQMMMRFCHSADMMQCRDLVLTTAENLLQLGNDVFQQSYLRFFLSECLSSAISLWHVMGKQLKEGAALNSRACSICADALVMGAVMAPKTCATAPHLLRLMVMAAKVFVLRAGRGDVELLPAAVRKIGQEKMPALAVAALARACWMVKDLVELKALVEGIVQQHLLGLLLETADDSPIAQASAWLLISVAQVTGCQNALVDVFNRGELLGKSPAILLAAASLDTLGSLTQSSRSNMAEVLRQTDLPGAEWTAYRETLAKALTQGQSQGVFTTPLASSGASAASFARWLHLLRDCEQPQPQGGESSKMIPLSGPPLFVYAQPIHSWVSSECHVTLRIDLFNATALSIRDVQAVLSISRPTRMGERGEKMAPWHFAEGLVRPLTSSPLEYIPCRSSATIWRDVYLRFPPKPMSLSLSFSYEKVMPETNLSGLTPASTPMTRGGGEDLWSDEEEEDHPRLHFTCLPISAALSWYFEPFLGFDESRAFPPPLLFAACPHSKTSEAKELGVTSRWTMKGFHQISPPSTDPGRTWRQGDCKCFAGIGCDLQSLLCFILRESESTLEVRSNNEWLLQAVTADLMFWLLADG
ncbi:unnamed protein product [Durusdinium trenchii]